MPVVDRWCPQFSPRSGTDMARRRRNVKPPCQAHETLRLMNNLDRMRHDNPCKARDYAAAQAQHSKRNICPYGRVRY